MSSPAGPDVHICMIIVQWTKHKQKTSHMKLKLKLTSQYKSWHINKLIIRCIKVILPSSWSLWFIQIDHRLYKLRPATKRQLGLLLSSWITHDIKSSLVSVKTPAYLLFFSGRVLVFLFFCLCVKQISCSFMLFFFNGTVDTFKNPKPNPKNLTFLVRLLWISLCSKNLSVRMSPLSMWTSYWLASSGRRWKKRSEVNLFPNQNWELREASKALTLHYIPRLAAHASNTGRMHLCSSICCCCFTTLFWITS